MREIKFRAWDKESNRMWAVETWHIEDEYLDLLEIGKNVADPSAEKIWKKQEYLELMQYTGLKDKNGVEIYEGDIVWDYYGETYGQVIFDNIGFRCGREGIFDDLDDVCLDIECVGNIYENNELLEE